MKLKALSLVCILFLFSCGSDDDNSPSINMSLLYGQWFSTNSCPAQNSLIFIEDGTYINIFSGNLCDSNDNDTYQYTGDFTVIGDDITFDQQTMEIIEEGDVPSIMDFELTTLIYQKIAILTETELLIERKFHNGEETYFFNSHYER